MCIVRYINSPVKNVSRLLASSLSLSLYVKIMTSKTDNPPSYEDTLHHPNYGNYPDQPQRGSPLPPPPSYSPGPGPSPGPPGYWGQEGVYPMWASPGLPPPGMPSTIPTLSAGVPPSNQGPGEMIRDLRFFHVLLYVEFATLFFPIPQETWRIF